jgi:hypothetical protein
MIGRDHDIGDVVRLYRRVGSYRSVGTTSKDHSCAPVAAGA